MSYHSRQHDNTRPVDPPSTAHAQFPFSITAGIETGTNNRFVGVDDSSTDRPGSSVAEHPACEWGSPGFDARPSLFFLFLQEPQTSPLHRTAVGNSILGCRPLCTLLQRRSSNEFLLSTISSSPTRRHAKSSTSNTSVGPI